MFVVHDLDVLFLSVLKLFLSNLCKSKSKMIFVLFILLETEFTKLRWLTYKIYDVH